MPYTTCSRTRKCGNSFLRLEPPVPTQGMVQEGKPYLRITAKINIIIATRLTSWPGRVVQALALTIPSDTYQMMTTTGTEPEACSSGRQGREPTRREDSPMRPTAPSHCSASTGRHSRGERKSTGKITLETSIIPNWVPGCLAHNHFQIQGHFKDFKVLEPF